MNCERQVNFCHALEEKKDQEQHEVEESNLKTTEEIVARRVDGGFEENGQEKTIEEEKIVERKSDPHEDNASAPRSAAANFLDYKRRVCL